MSADTSITKRRLRSFVDSNEIRLENYGTASTILPAGKIEEAQAAFEKLQGTGITLLEAVDEVLRLRNARESSVTFKEMFERFVEGKRKRNRSSAYLTALRCTLPRFTALHDRPVSEISAPEVEQELAGTSPSVHNAFLRYLRAAFNFGIRQGWCEHNPVERIEMHFLRMRREILSNPQVNKLLRVVRESEFDLLPYHVLCSLPVFDRVKQSSSSGATFTWVATNSSRFLRKNQKRGDDASSKWNRCS